VIVLKSPQEIKVMRSACQIVAETLCLLRQAVKPGVVLLELNALAEKEAVKHKAKTAFKGYSGYPYSLCCSVNEQVVHGMPSARQLLEGDILSLDFGVLYQGFYGDAAITVPVGEITQEAHRLIKVTEESLYKGIAAATVSNRLSDISFAVQSHVEGCGFSVVRDFVGHGIGRQLHEGPQIPNYGAPGRGPHLKAGMVLAIEPMINQGSYEVQVLQDGWTAVTIDGNLSAHFEHTVAVTDNGPEILTAL
jgi:methionyl aminopeptidase